MSAERNNNKQKCSNIGIKSTEQLETFEIKK